MTAATARFSALLPSLPMSSCQAVRHRPTKLAAVSAYLMSAEETGGGGNSQETSQGEMATQREGRKRRLGGPRRPLL